jgi:hypothetical protein
MNSLQKNTLYPDEKVLQNTPSNNWFLRNMFQLWTASSLGALLQLNCDTTYVILFYNEHNHYYKLINSIPILFIVINSLLIR